MLTDPTSKQLDAIKKEGLRPGVVLGFVNKNKILMFFKRDYGIWMLPQGGIKLKETPNDTIARKIARETGHDVTEESLAKKQLILTEKFIFHKTKHGEKQLETSLGEMYPMIGKHFFFYTIPTTHTSIDINKGEFDDYFWVDYKEAKYLVSCMNIRKKAALIDKFLDILKEKEIIN